MPDPQDALAAVLDKVLGEWYDQQQFGSGSVFFGEFAAPRLAASGWTLAPKSSASERLDEIQRRYEAEIAATNARIAALRQPDVERMAGMLHDLMPDCHPLDYESESDKRCVRRAEILLRWMKGEPR